MVTAKAKTKKNNKSPQMRAFFSLPCDIPLKHTEFKRESIQELTIENFLPILFWPVDERVHTP